MARAKKPRRGRPPLGAAGKTHALIVKVSQDNLKRCQAAADRQGITLSEWAREAFELALARGSTR